MRYWGYFLLPPPVISGVEDDTVTGKAVVPRNHGNYRWDEENLTVIPWKRQIGCGNTAATVTTFCGNDTERKNYVM